MQKLCIKKLVVPILLIAVLNLASCAGSAGNPVQKSGRLTIVTSIFPYYDFARQIVKDNAEVINIVPPGVEPHEYEPGTGDIKKIYGANIFIYNGLGMDPWAERLKPDLEKMGVKVINISESISSIKLIGLAENSAGSDPHIWMDFRNAVSAFKIIFENINQADGLTNGAFYLKNYQTYGKDLQDLAGRFGSELSHCGIKDFISSHLAFEYLAQAAGLTAWSISGVSTEQEPSAKKLTELTKIIRDKNLKYIYIDSLDSSKFADVLAAETGISVEKLYTLENLTKDQWADPAITYITQMTANLENLKKGLQCTGTPIK